MACAAPHRSEISRVHERVVAKGLLVATIKNTMLRIEYRRAQNGILALADVPITDTDLN
jgi:hypothetical protein